VSLLLLEGDLLAGFGGCSAVSSSWKFVKRHGLLLRGDCEVVLELSIFGVEEKLTIRRSPNFVRGSGKKLSFRSIRGSFVVTRTSPTVISLRVSEHRDTSSSPRASVISIPKFISL
jgi:hypothetical protein